MAELATGGIVSKGWSYESDGGCIIPPRGARSSVLDLPATTIHLDSALPALKALLDNISTNRRTS